MPAKPPEPGAVSRTVAATVRQLRQAQGLSLQQLSTKVSSFGARLNVDALYRIENGCAEPGTRASRYVRHVGVDDLVALAAALDVTPATLLDGVDSQADRGGGHRSVSLVGCLDAAVRDAFDPTAATDVAARLRSARRLMTQLGLELDEAEDRIERDRHTESDKEGKD